jgi:hypothetical protein
MALYRVVVNGAPQPDIEAPNDNAAVDAARAAAMAMTGDLTFEVTAEDGRHVSGFSCFHEPPVAP